MSQIMVAMQSDEKLTIFIKISTVNIAADVLSTPHLLALLDDPYNFIANYKATQQVATVDDCCRC